MDTRLCKLPRNTLSDIGSKSKKIYPATTFLRGSPTLQDLHLRMIVSSSLLIDLVGLNRNRSRRSAAALRINAYRKIPRKRVAVDQMDWLGSICLSIEWSTSYVWNQVRFLISLVLRGRYRLGYSDFQADGISPERFEIYSELDVCFKPVVHVLRGDDIIGIASEKRAGRELRYSDKRMVRWAVLRLRHV
ncbi:hypothetical protein L218DRAFT_945540 [Marasmius fiardii PR-910]|nr:hypothetical protein L218DRAFT_945540 [Marasmius fiardii PR-910]